MRIMTEAQVLNNSKIILRRFRESDLDQLIRVTSDQEVMEHIGGPMTSSETKSYLSELIQNEDNSEAMFALVYKPTMEFAGFAGFAHNGSPYPGIHVAIMKQFQRKGLAKEAFKFFTNYSRNVLNKTTVIAYIKSGNRTAKKVLRKMDFKFKKFEFKSGRSHELYEFSPSFLMN